MPHESPDSPRGKFRRQLRALPIGQLVNADPKKDGSAEKQPWRTVIYQEVLAERTSNA